MVLHDKHELYKSLHGSLQPTDFSESPFTHSSHPTQHQPNKRDLRLLRATEKGVDEGCNW